MSEQREARGESLVVRGFGYEVRHVVTVPETSLRWCTTMGSVFPGILTPLVARCGVSVRSHQPVVVVMQAGTKVTCKQCVRWTGITEQAETATVWRAASSAPASSAANNCEWR